MLFEYGAKNYFSFKEGFEISLRLNNQCPDSISRGRPFANVVCVKGSNASGKTNVLKALNFIRDFCIDSFGYKPDDEIPLEPHFDNDAASEFFIVFAIEEIEYRYELEATKTAVLVETIYRKNQRYTKIIERRGDIISYVNKDFAELKPMKIRKNASLISTAHQYEFQSIEKIYSFIRSIFTNVTRFGLYSFDPDISKISEFYKNDDKLFQFVIDQIKSCDVGIVDIKILEREDENKEKRYFPIFYHDFENSTKSLTIYFESSGTKALYSILFLYKLTLNIGGVLVLDEFDINLHPHILPKLVKLFDDESNTKNAQLIFTTHNEKIMDDLGKYRTILVNKENNCSYAYRLDELPGDILRNDRLISKTYASGKIGGVPRI